MLLYYSTVLKYIGQREECEAARSACSNLGTHRNPELDATACRVSRFSVACFGT